MTPERRPQTTRFCLAGLQIAGTLRNLDVGSDSSKTDVLLGVSLLEQDAQQVRTTNPQFRDLGERT